VVFLLLDGLLKLFFCLFGSSRYASWGLGFEIHAFVVNGLIKGEIAKQSSQFIGLIVMSH
jgi:hypothetical protein